MKNTDIIRTMVFDFLNVIAECTVSVAIIGSIFAKDVQITYAYFFVPIILSVFYMLPCLPIYFKENMSVAGVMIQRTVELVIIEAASLFAAYLLIGSVLDTAGYVVVGILVSVFDVLSYLLHWLYEKSTADKINKIIAEMRSEKE